MSSATLGAVGSTTPVCRKCSRNQPNAFGSVCRNATLASSIRKEPLQNLLVEVVGLQAPAAHPLTQTGDRPQLSLPPGLTHRFSGLTHHFFLRF